MHDDINSYLMFMHESKVKMYATTIKMCAKIEQTDKNKQANNLTSKAQFNKNKFLSESPSVTKTIIQALHAAISGDGRWFVENKFLIIIKL